MIRDCIHGCFPLVSEHFVCWCDGEYFSLPFFKASIYSASHSSVGKLFLSLATDAAV